uniref:BTB domain-containing protein n=1 Tax=Panagrolaimus davidi TaxID=227884 RepID=A0A914PIT6_9BILA
MSDASPVFAAMFQSKMKETIENKMDLIKFDFNTVEFAIELCYDKKILEDLDLDFCKDLLRFSDKYDIQKIREQIEAEIRSKITCLNVVEIANLSILFNAPNLRQMCFDFILCSNYNESPLDNIENLDENLALEIAQQSYYRTSETVHKEFYN